MAEWIAGEKLDGDKMLKELIQIWETPPQGWTYLGDIPDGDALWAILHPKRSGRDVPLTETKDG